MRVLCTVSGSLGHVHNIVPLTRALSEAGHQVLFLTTDELAARLAREPGQVMAALANTRQRIEPLLTFMRTGQGMTVDEAQRFKDQAYALASVSTGPHLSAAVRGVLPTMKEFAPDVVLRDGAELAGCLIAEQLGVPHVSAPSGAGNILDPYLVSEPLDRRRAELGLPELRDPMSIHRHGRLDCVPARYSFTAHEIPSALVYQQAEPPADQRVLPADIAELPGDRPLVLASVGSELPKAGATIGGGLSLGVADPADTLRALVDAVSTLDCSAVVSTGRLYVDSLQSTESVRVADWVPQPLVLRCADLFITHGGYNGIREALLAGVPMVVLPQFGDQDHNADRVVEFGLGVRLPVATTDPELIAAACRAVLAEPGYTARARHARRRMLALPGIDTAVAWLAALATR
ncbi:glycosyltransferase [Kutzneria kofuensis]|uniref:N-glycosyltransferase n=1 Tax=Kutzneria kofuensis TaxID=103725 RepID=A0A7W9KEY1_9PSEU|nr:glycosyltransferase [Kutzneria kofuensis]MBB5891343.1 N-glycosyltransferase [Kutzneria kofuensis]